MSFPESFAEHETRYIGALITSFHKSCSNYMHRLSMLKRMAPLLNFRQAEEIMQLISTKIAQEQPAENPFYFAPNLLLMSVLIYETAHIFKAQYDFLSGIATQI